MKRHPFISLLLPIALLAACAQQPPAPTPAPAPAPRAQAGGPLVIVQLYRGLRVLAGTVNQIDWTRASFGVSGQPVSTLSLFDNMGNGQAFPCWLQITVNVPGALPPVPGLSVGDLTIPNPPPGTANPGPWPATFDNIPPGHWSITGATIGGANNTQASNNAAAVFNAMAHNVPATAVVIDGSAVGCH